MSQLGFDSVLVMQAVYELIYVHEDSNYLLHNLFIKQYKCLTFIFII